MSRFADTARGSARARRRVRRPAARGSAEERPRVRRPAARGSAEERPRVRRPAARGSAGPRRRLRPILLAAALVSSLGAGSAQAAVRVGPVALELSSEWRTQTSGDDRTVLVRTDGAAGRIVVAFGPPHDRSLVLGERVAGAPRPVRVGGYAAWSYGEVTVLPTGAGVLAVACPARCATAIRSVSVRGAAVLAPTADTAFALAAPPVLAGLDAERVRLRGRLGDAASRADQARAARGLADEHRAAADRLRGLAGPAGAPVVTRLDELGRDYAALASAATGRSRARFDAARSAVERADLALAGAVRAAGAVELLRAQRTPVRPAPAPKEAGSSLLLVLLPIAALIAFALALLRRRRREPPEAPPAPRPIATRPAGAPFARWDAPPGHVTLTDAAGTLER